MFVGTYGNYGKHISYDDCIFTEDFKKFKIINKSDYICRYQKIPKEKIIIECISKNVILDWEEKTGKTWLWNPTKWEKIVEDANGLCLYIFNNFNNILAIDENKQVYEFFYLPICFEHETKNWKGEDVKTEDYYIAIQIYRKVKAIEMITKTNKGNNNQ